MNDIDVILAERKGTGAIRLCGCNSIHMSIGPVTINLEPEAFAQTALLVQQAMESLSIIVAADEPENGQSQRPN